MTEQHPTMDNEMGRTIQMHMDLIEALVGEQHARQCPLDLRIMGVLHTLDDAERSAIQTLITKCQELRASYNLTVEDVAKRFRISIRQVQRLAQAGALNGSRIGGRWVFTEKQLDRYLKAHTYTGNERELPLGADWLARSDATLLARARAALGADVAERAGLQLLWTIRQLAEAFPLEHNDARMLVLKWHAGGVIDRAGRSRYRFRELP